MSEVNIPLLRKAVEWAEAEAALGQDDRGLPVGHWYQGEWRIDWNENNEGYVEEPAACGTTYCIAGYVGQLLDQRFQQATKITDDDGFVVHVEKYAKEALGLSWDEAELLFDGDNDIEDVRRIAEEIAGERL